MNENATPNWKFYMVELSSALSFLYEQNQAQKAARPDSYFASETELVLEDARAAAKALDTMMTNAFPSQTNSPADAATPIDRQQALRT